MNKENEIVHKLDNDAYKVFKLKGEQNAVKVRRILQLTKDLAQCKISELKILDLGCAEGVYAIEAALRGADVVAIDGREERMDLGRSVAKRKGLFNVKFSKQDVRNISIEQLGEFDIVYFLGLLYHLDASDIFVLMPKLFDMCKRFMIIDTRIALEGKDTVFDRGVQYNGIKVREYQEKDSFETVESRLGSSLINIFSFHFTKESLLRLLKKIGFTTVLECYVPFEPGEEKIKGDRITLVAVKGNSVRISSYPWLNDMSEEEIEEKMKKLGPWRAYWESPIKETCHTRVQTKSQTFKYLIKRGINGVLGKFGYELRRK